MNDYAPEYTKRERVILILRHLAWALPLVVVTKIWFFPWFENYADNAHCFNYGAFTGVHVVFYGVCVGIPLMSALMIFAVEGPRSIKVMQLGQDPLPGEKVYKSKKYCYGLKAKIKPFILFSILIFLVGLSIRGFFWANEIIDLPRQKEMPLCVNS